MDTRLQTIIGFLETVHPYDSLPQDELARVAGSFSRREYKAKEEVYHAGEPLRFLFLVKRGAVEVLEAQREGKRPMAAADVLKGLSLPDHLN